MNRTIKTFAAVVLATFAFSASAAPIDVLWLGGSNTYNTDIATLAAGGVNDASTYDPDLDGSNTWTIDFWTAGLPDFDDYDVLVIGSTCVPGCPGAGAGSTTFFDLGVTPDLVLANEAALDTARGDRTFVSGQDADWHFTLDPNAVDSADARAFLVNAVNWAASGTGLGVVVLADGYPASDTGWLDHADSFLAADIGNSRTMFNNESVVIPGPVEAAFPINEGLNDASLSDWGISSHTRFEKALLDPLVWTTINDLGTDPDYAITIVSTATAGGATVAEPGTLALLGLGLLGFARSRRKSAA